MTKDNPYEWDVTPGNNSDIAGTGIEGSNLPSNFDNALREVMAQIAKRIAAVNGTKTTTGSSNAYVLSTGLSYAALADGLEAAFMANHANTGAATLAVDGLAAKAIRQPDGTALTAGAIKSGQFCRCVYDLGNEYWLLHSGVSAAAADALVWCGTAGGTANALTLTPSPAIAAYDTGRRFVFQAGSSASTGAVTIAVSGLATQAAEFDNTALSSSLTIEANKYYSALYDGAAFQLTRLSRNPVEPSAATFSPDTDDSFDLGTSSLRWQDLFLSGGLYLGGTTSTNRMTDYEKSTWTPELQFGGAAVGMTYAVQSGRYTKAGAIVVAECQITLSAKGTSTGTATVIGLPFTPQGTVRARISFNNAASALNASGIEIEFPGSTTGTLRLLGDSGTAYSGITDGVVANNTEILFTLTYITNA